MILIQNKTLLAVLICCTFGSIVQSQNVLNSFRRFVSNSSLAKLTKFGRHSNSNMSTSTTSVPLNQNQTINSINNINTTNSTNIAKITNNTNNTNTSSVSDDTFFKILQEHVDKFSEQTFKRYQKEKPDDSEWQKLLIKTSYPDQLTPSYVSKLSVEKQIAFRKFQASMQKKMIQHLEKDTLQNSNNTWSDDQVDDSVPTVEAGLIPEQRTNNSNSNKYQLDRVLLQDLVLCHIGDKPSTGPFTALSTFASKLQFGDLIEIKRSGYSHFAVYLGASKVLELQNPSFGQLRPTNVFNDFESITLVSNLNEVVNGSVCRINNKRKFDFPVKVDQVKERVRIALQTNGTLPYNIFANNCEHFATFVRFGIGFSEQVTALFGVARDIGKSYAHLLFEERIL